jgi:hypothetical protein
MIAALNGDYSHFVSQLIMHEKITFRNKLLQAGKQQLT